MILLVLFIYYAVIIKSAIKNKTNIKTTSYIFFIILELVTTTKKADIIILNKIDIDLRVDYLYTIKTINKLHAKDGKIYKLFSKGI